MINPQFKMTCICAYTDYLNGVYFKLDLKNLELEYAESRVTFFYRWK